MLTRGGCGRGWAQEPVLWEGSGVARWWMRITLCVLSDQVWVPGFREEDEKRGGGATRIQTDMDIANIVVVVRACVVCVCLDLEGEGGETRKIALLVAAGQPKSRPHPQLSAWPWAHLVQPGHSPPRRDNAQRPALSHPRHSSAI